MAITRPLWLVQPRIDGSPGILTGDGAPVAEIYDRGVLYTRRDAVGFHLSDGAGTWTTLLDSASAIASHPATATAAGGTGATGSDGTGATGSDGTGATGGTAPAFTGDSPTTAVMDYIPQGGTGFATVGQVITTTENKNLLLNELAGSWFLGAATPPCLILSNTAVAGAPGVLTVYGAAPATDAGTYKILRAPPPTGTVASHTHTGPAHTHTGPAHTHTGPSHTHDTPILAHTITP